MLCPSFDKIDPLMGDGTLANLSFVGDSMDGMDAKDIFFGFFSWAQTLTQVASDFVFEQWDDSHENEKDVLDLDEDGSNHEGKGLSPINPIVVCTQTTYNCNNSRKKTHKQVNEAMPFGNFGMIN